MYKNTGILFSNVRTQQIIVRASKSSEWDGKTFAVITMSDALINRLTYAAQTARELKKAWEAFNFLSFADAFHLDFYELDAANPDLEPVADFLANDDNAGWSWIVIEPHVLNMLEMPERLHQLETLVDRYCDVSWRGVGKFSGTEYFTSVSIQIPELIMQFYVPVEYAEAVENYEIGLFDETTLEGIAESITSENQPHYVEINVHTAFDIVNDVKNMNAHEEVA